MEQALIDYINSANAKSQAWMDAEEGRWSGMIPTDEQYWIDRGCTTLEQYMRETLEEDAYYTIAEATSKSYARSFDFTTMSDEQLNVMCNEYGAMIEQQIQEQEAEDLLIVTNFEKSIAEMISWGAKTRETAIRWLLEAQQFDEYDLAYGGSFACHTMNLPTNKYHQEFDMVMQTMQPYSEVA